MSKVKMGRPTVVTPEVLRKLEEAFALGCTDLEACLYADIASSTFYDYQKAHPDFLDRKLELKETPVLKARTTVVNNLHDPDLALKYLERKKKDEFGTKVTNEHVGKDGMELINKVEIIPYNGNSTSKSTTKDSEDI